MFAFNRERPRPLDAKVFHPELSDGHSSGVIENKTQTTDHMLESTTVCDAVTFAGTKSSVRGSPALVPFP